MARAPLALIELWSHFACAGGVRRAIVAQPLGASAALRLRGDSRTTFDLPLGDPAIADVTIGAVARLVYADQTWDEWRIDRLSTEVTPNGEVRRATLAAPLWDLGAAGKITEYDATGIPTFSGARYQITPADLITTVILPWLTARGVTWVALGTIDPTAPLDVEWDSVDPLGLLHQLEELTQTELQLRRNGTADYRIDLLTAINGSQPVADLREGKNLLSTVLTEDGTQRFSLLTGLGAADPAGRRAVIGRAVWEVTAVNTTTDRLTLADPEGGGDPILEDDQLNGLYLYDLPSGTTDQILDTIGATQQVQVADASVYAIGDLLEVRLSAGTGAYKDNALLVTSLSRPSITPLRAGTLDRPDLFGERNLVRNGWFTDWTNGPHAAPDGWTLHAGTLAQHIREATYAELGAYTAALRFQPYQLSATALTTGQDTVTGIDGGYFYVGQTVEVFSYPYTLFETFTVIAVTSTTVQLSGGVSYDHVGITGIRAPGARFPIFQLFGAWPGLVSGVVRAPVSGGSIFCAQAKLMLSGLPLGQYQARLYVERYNAANLMIGRIEAQTTVMDQWVVLGCSVQAAAGEQLRVGVELHDDPTYPGLVATYQAPSSGRLIVDGISLTQTDYQPTGIPNYSFGNAFWHAVNRALASTTAGASYEVGILDLTALDPAGWPDDELLLGGTVRVNNASAGLVNQALRIVELQRPNLFEPAQCSVVLNARRAELTEIVDRALQGSAGGRGGGAGAGGSGGASGTPLAPSTIPVKIPFHAAGDGAAPYTLALGAHGAAVTEIDTGLRTWLDTTGALKLRLETVVGTPGATGAEIAVRYSADNGANWAYLDGASGPGVAIDAVGAVAGTFILPVVRGDILLQLVMRGGDTVASPILRNTMLYVFYAVLAAPVPTPTPPIALPPSTMCALSSDAVQGDDFAGALGMPNYANEADLLSVVGVDRRIYYTGVMGTAGVDVIFDGADTVGGHRSLDLVYETGQNEGPFWKSQWSDGVGPSETPVGYDDFWYRIALKIPSAFTSIDTPSYSPSMDGANGGVPSSGAGALPGNFQRGLVLLVLEPADRLTNVGADRDITLNLSIKGDGRLYVEGLWYEQPSPPGGPLFQRWIQQDIGAASALADDQWHDLIVRVRRTPGDDTSARITVYVGDVCALGIAALAEVDVGPHTDLLNMVGRTTTGPWGLLWVPGYIYPTTTASHTAPLTTFGPATISVGRHEMVPYAVNSNPFGVV